MGVFSWLRSLGRQRIVGWFLIIIAALYLIYFVRMRLFEPGDPIAVREWMAVIASVAMVGMGTMNIRLADMRDKLLEKQRRNEEQIRARAAAERKAARRRDIKKQNYDA